VQEGLLSENWGDWVFDFTHMEGAVVLHNNSRYFLEIIQQYNPSGKARRKFGHVLSSSKVLVKQANPAHITWYLVHEVQVHTQHMTQLVWNSAYETNRKVLRI
jgi:hypothetical protein